MSLRCRLGLHQFMVTRTCPLTTTHIGLITGMRSEERQSIGKHFRCKRCGNQRAEIVELNGRRHKIDPAFFANMKGRKE